MTRMRILVFTLLFAAIALRIYGIDWDDGHHLHPDERMLIMVADRIDFFDNLNPDFFNYGSLPIYLLKGTSDFVSFISRTPVNNYNGMLLVGRMLSVFFDVLTVIVIFKISRILFKNISVAFFSSFFYAISFFPIQNSHFFIVDPILTFFITASLYLLLRYIKDPSYIKIVEISLMAAGAITTKFTGILLLPVVGLALIIGRFTTNQKQLKTILLIAKLRITNYELRYLLFGILFLSFSFLFMPYAFVNHQQFIKEITLQLKMNSDPFVFPYTLQYVGTTSYWYYLKNIFLWGMGPIISITAFFGLAFLVKNIYASLSKMKLSKLRITNYELQIIIATLYFILHFAIIGRSAVKFMRYMLPLYPYLAILAGYGLSCVTRYTLHVTQRKIPIGRYIVFVFIFLSIIWTSMFLSIYSQPNTRIQASEWIYENVPTGATLAVSHWDDRLPLQLPSGKSKTYQFEELALYEADTTNKWEKIDNQLERSDYIIIASNRLYTPLMRLTNCQELPQHRCYPQTAQYYRDLFNEKLDFTKSAEFTSYPEITIGGLRFTIYDEHADESFTVYDHPKVMIYEKNKR